VITTIGVTAIIIVVPSTTPVPQHNSYIAATLRYTIRPQALHRRYATRYRSKPSVHKRLILLANLAIIDVALDRFPVPWDWWSNRIANLLIVCPIVLLLMGYDGWSTKKIQPVTLWGGLSLMATEQIIRPFIAHTAAFQSFAAWMQIHARPYV
jgi:hypothetical protein